MQKLGGGAFRKGIMVEITRIKWRFIGHILRKDSTSISGTGLFWTPEDKRKRRFPGLHAVEHYRKKLWGCPGQSPGKRRRIYGAGEHNKDT